MPAKSFKADGTPKARWSASDRATRGHAPRRRGGQPRKRTAADTPESSRRPDQAPTARTAAPSQRSQTHSLAVKPARRAYAKPAGEAAPERRERKHASVRPDRIERSSSSPRPDRRPFRVDGSERTDRYPRTDRPERSDRPVRAERSDRPVRAERTDRYPRTARPERSDRPVRAERSDRPARAERTDRPPLQRTDRPTRTPERSAPVIQPPARSDSTPIAVGVGATPDFTALGLPAHLVDQLAAEGITTPFPIQAATIPTALAGRDVLGRAQTGSGKTLAFGLPMIVRLSGRGDTRGRAPRGLVLVPTRELAMQVTDALTPLARTADLGVVLVAGGMSYTPQQRAFARGVDIVVATPGRLLDLMDQGTVDLSEVAVTVLDEADHMADLGFMPAVTQILDAEPAAGQRLLFSATLDAAVDQLVRRYLDDPVTSEVDSARASVTTMAHHVVHVAPKDKARVTADIATRPGRTVLFVRTQLAADRVAEQLRSAGVLAGSLHGGLAQGARTRILAAFRDGTLPALVATDVAARGIHVDDVGLVLQVDPPHGGKEYLHRAGRTARAGGTGQVVTLVLPHQRREVGRLLAVAGVRGGELSATPGDPALAEVTGARPGNATPITETTYQQLIAPPTARRRPGGKRPRPYDKRR